MSIKDNIRKKIFLLKRDYYSFSSITFALSILLAGVFSVWAITSSAHNWQQELKMADLRADIAKAALEIEILSYERAYLETTEYQELAARKYQNKLLPGEKMLILPKNSEAAKNKYQDETATETRQPSNFEEWLRFLFS